MNLTVPGAQCSVLRAVLRAGCRVPGATCLVRGARPAQVRRRGGRSGRRLRWLTAARCPSSHQPERTRQRRPHARPPGWPGASENVARCSRPTTHRNGGAADRVNGSARGDGRAPACDLGSCRPRDRRRSRPRTDDRPIRRRLRFVEHPVHRPVRPGRRTASTSPDRQTTG